MSRIDIKSFENSKNLLLWFITVNFPEGYDEEQDISFSSAQIGTAFSVIFFILIFVISSNKSLVSAFCGNATFIFNMLSFSSNS